MDYTRQTRFSDPGRHLGRLAALSGTAALPGAALPGGAAPSDAAPSGGAASAGAGLFGGAASVGAGLFGGAASAGAGFGGAASAGAGLFGGAASVGAGLSGAAGCSGVVAGIGAAVRNLVVHYRASGLDFPPDRLAEIDSRWVETMLDTLPPGVPLDEPRPADQRIVGCCRDFTLLTVAALRAGGVPARSRGGVADYFHPGFHCDHVITEYHDGSRWIATDTQLDPAAGFPVDAADVPLGPGGLRTAAQSWLAFRRGEIDPETYGVGPGIPLGGPLFIRKYVVTELAHRMGDETLLWDFWGSDRAMLADLDGRPLTEAWSDLPSWDSGDVTLIDEIASLLVASDAGDSSAEDRLALLYATDPRVHVGDTVTCHSPRGNRYDVDLRHPSPAAA
jgi:hypothetical protein